MPTAFAPPLSLSAVPTAPPFSRLWRSELDLDLGLDLDSPKRIPGSRGKFS